jgi:hypothetical protein
MNYRRCSLLFVSASVALATPCLASLAADDDQDTSHRLSLGDLAGYGAALSGKPTAEGAKATDPPVQVNFNELWNRPDAFQGRRVVVQGRMVRIFRQGPIGSFPPLAEVWMTSRGGNPFCVVFPQRGVLDDTHAASGNMKLTPKEKPASGHQSDEMPGPGRMVQFTGTFLKMVRYAGADTARLAPLIVGDRPPVVSSFEPVERQADYAPSGVTRGSGLAIRLAYWALGLAGAAIAAVLFVRWHLGLGTRSESLRAQSANLALDPPLEFLGPPNEP